MASNKMPKAILLPYAKPYTLTDGLIQGARLEARKEIFGSPKENVHYTLHVKNALLAQGHHVSVKLTERKETVKNVQRLVVPEELMRLKMLNQTMGAAERKDFGKKWIKDNTDLLVSQLGPRNQGSNFVHGILFAPSFTKATVPHLQPVFMADACRLKFGKYTLFSCYGRTANANVTCCICDCLWQ